MKSEKYIPIAFVVFFVIMLLLWCSSMPKEGDVVAMRVAGISGYQVYELEYNGTIYCCLGCPLVPLPAVSDTVFIELSSGKWIARKKLWKK